MKNWQALGDEAKASASKVWGNGIVTAALLAVFFAIGYLMAPITIR